MKIEVTDAKDDELAARLVSAVREYNTEFLGYTDSRPLAAIARDDRGETVGGVSGRTIYGHFLVEVVWVAEAMRGQGLGTELMERAEREARARQCTGAQVDTLSFQGLDFYRRLGFEVIGKVEGFPLGHDRYFMLKHYR